MICTHDGPCGVHQSASTCRLLQRAEARKYDCNLAWHFAELEPDVWCLYSPDRRKPSVIGTLDEVIGAYRNREPVVFTRTQLTPPPKSPKFSGLTFNL